MQRLLGLLALLLAVAACESRRPAGNPAPPPTVDAAPPVIPERSDEPASDQPAGWPSDAGSADPARPPVEPPQPLPTTAPPEGIAE